MKDIYEILSFYLTVLSLLKIYITVLYHLNAEFSKINATASVALTFFVCFKWC